MMLLAVTGLRREARIAQNEHVVAISGGGNSASLETQLAAALRGPVHGVVSLGIAGALAPHLEPGDCVIASRVIDGEEIFESDGAWLESMSSRLPKAHVGAIAGSRTILVSAAQKAEAFRRTGAAVVDMESHLAAKAARDCGLPFIAIRTISDGAGRALPPAAQAALKPDGGIDLWSVARSLAARPTQIPALLQTARETEKAFSALLGCLDMLGRRLAFPDLG